MSDRNSPAEVCRLRHNSAVKSLMFCPWSPLILATGGGSNDRAMHFWHIPSGSLLSSHNTGRQITSVTWSRSRRELAVSYGYLPLETSSVVEVFSFPEMKLVAQGRTRLQIRALSASVSPDERKIAIAANDGTFRIFSLWEARPYVLVEGGSLGSLLLDALESVPLSGTNLR